jgi:hypothetical protein
MRSRSVMRLSLGFVVAAAFTGITFAACTAAAAEPEPAPKAEKSAEAPAPGPSKEIT